MKPLLANSGVLYVTWIALVSELTITSIHAVPRIHFDNYRCVAQRRKRGFNLLQLKSISKGDRGKFTRKSPLLFLRKVRQLLIALLVLQRQVSTERAVNLKL
jgi:hypothetical protein